MDNSVHYYSVWSKQKLYRKGFYFKISFRPRFLSNKRNGLIYKERKVRLLNWSMFEKRGENEAF